MASLAHSSRALLRAVPRTTGSVRALSTTAQQKADQPGAAPAFKSPFKAYETTKIPDFSNYKSTNAKSNNLLFQYFMVGTMGALTAAGAKATVQGMWMLCVGWDGVN